MPKKKRNPNAVYEMITERILELLDKGTIPWRKPWKVEVHRNLISKRPYRGINTFLLDCAEYSSPYWLTFNQAKKLGANVRKGERSSIVVFWKWLDRKVENEETGEEEIKRYPMLRYYRVFNAEQIDVPDGSIERLMKSKAIPAWGTEDAEEEAEVSMDAEQIWRSMPKLPKVSFTGSVACYRPKLDEVVVPERNDFESTAAFHSTLFHELVHSTGHSKRLGRIKKWTGFGSHEYSQEELVAEMGAAMLNAIAGLIDDREIENSAAYIAHWRKRISEDPKLVVMAAAQAQKAADFILDRKAGEEKRAA